MLEFKKGELLSKHTTFKIGGPAGYFCSPKTQEEITEALAFAKKNKLRVFVIGMGSNILAPDDGFDGLVVKLETAYAFIHREIVVAGAGLPLILLLHNLANEGLSGLEFLVGVPGTVGGAVVMNAGLNDLAIGERVKKVRALDFNGEDKIFVKTACKFDYRKSIFQKEEYIITEVEFKLKKGDPAQIKEKIDKFIKERLSKQPYNFPSAGSIFRNPKGDFAGRLIEAAGCKGMSVGKAKVSEKHANFIVNTGKAKASDVLGLMAKIQRKVKEKFGKTLVPEIKIMVS